MIIAIHDKTPEGRKKLKEGPKAQEKYVEELASEWIDNHATKDPVLADKVARAKAREAQIPAAVKAKALRHEADIAERMGLNYNPGKEKLVEDFRERKAARKSSAMKHFIAVLNADVAMLGHIRDFWVDRYRAQGLNVGRCNHCGGAVRFDEADYPTHCTQYDMDRCAQMFDDERAENRRQLSDFCEEHGIING